MYDLIPSKKISCSQPTTTASLAALLALMHLSHQNIKSTVQVKSFGSNFRENSPHH